MEEYQEELGDVFKSHQMASRLVSSMICGVETRP
jgi:hypothetical protein